MAVTFLFGAIEARKNAVKYKHQKQIIFGIQNKYFFASLYAL
jgi:hypothetical protein